MRLTGSRRDRALNIKRESLVGGYSDQVSIHGVLVRHADICRWL